MTRSAIYAGDVVHARTRPRQHRLHYRVFALLIDLDELGALNRGLRLFGHNRWAAFGFRDKDHGDGVTPLRHWAGRLLEEADAGYDGGRIELLCYPRVLGFVFNPLSVYFGYTRAGELAAILYEVHNTHGERHTYVIPAKAEGEVVRHSARKQFFVSPFMPMDCVYRFRIRPPGERVGISILEHDAEGLLLSASFTGRREELSDGALWRMLLAYPLMTLKVVAGIHVEALRLLLKGVPFHHHRRAARRIDSVVVRPEAEASAADHAPGHRQTEPVG